MGFFFLLVWADFLYEGYRITVFTIACFQIFPCLKHKKGKCHNGYST